MKTYVNLSQYLAEVFLNWEIFQTKLVEEIKINILCSVTFFLKLCHFLDNVAKYCTATQATDDNIIRSRITLFACRITEARLWTHTHW
jgi:hypothetical protein